MGHHNLPKLLAFLVNFCGIFLFRTLEKNCMHENSSALPSMIFALAVYTYSTDAAFFKLPYTALILPCQFVLDFLATAFLIETALLDFWFPLENFVLSLLLCCSDALKTYKCFGMNISLCCKIYHFFRSYNTALFASYSLAFFFIVCVLQGTRVLDFYLIRCGLDVLVQALYSRLQRGVHRLLPYHGMKVYSCGGGSPKQKCINNF